MALHLWMVTLTLAAFLAMDRFQQPICEHMAESPKCPQTPKPICGTDGVTYKNECHLCVTRIKTQKDIQIRKDGKC
ncbi:serine protease inhibitor Kazal-type 4 [Peromyscus eremicus]|uniref:serine protease inhibitor Kazal-type 4 n=1 Tax=Peromyscus eremicus TaxID=42410 RepID=UPI0027DE28B6|nr:serine protease inhibitor Kazal-type 4 [Peromyscus eremicus]